MTADDVLTTRARLAAPAARVHRALTDPAELTAWFAEHAEVDLPRAYTFWGPGVPDGDTPHQTLRHVDDHTVRFEWRLEDTDTTVEWALAPDGPDATVVTLSQTHFPGWEAAMAGTGPLAVMHSFWALAASTRRPRPTAPGWAGSRVWPSCAATTSSPTGGRSGSRSTPRACRRACSPCERAVLVLRPVVPVWTAPAL